ncbi:MAG: aldehyde dehydrogenase family protein [Nevskiaceae bacterium]|nr:MAG: aldehyde dehydrogenase family protein [Nevskiaceae bacterium]TBR73097.1 MAG: aldehyde dehydrogenase family protein [Nevskiaceae bacterium]
MNAVASAVERDVGNVVHDRIREVFERQQATALRLRASTAEERIAKLRKLKQAVLDYTPQWYEAGAADYRKPQAEMDLAEILPVIAEANDAIRHLKKWMRPHRVRPTLPMLGTQAWVQLQPRGRCLIISPWNYPVNLTFGPLISAIAAGNTAILKPSEMTPHLSAVMARLVAEVFREDEVALFEGNVDVSTALLELPFDHIFFTGAPAIGKVVMAAAAKHLTSVTLELGGRSPTIIEPDAKLHEAARNLMWSKFTNCGQTCIAPDHIYVHESVKDAFVNECRAALEHGYGADAAKLEDNPDYGRIVNSRHTGRVKALLDDARAHGAQAVVGGTVDEANSYIAPTLLENVPADAKILKTEIFGPLLPIIPYGNLDEVIQRINADPKPLALYVWGNTQANIDKVLARTSSGGACVNHSVVQFLHGNLPFGGVNNSGIGHGHGHYGFAAFSHERAVVRNRWSLTALFAPPYTSRLRKLVHWLMKIV